MFRRHRVNDQIVKVNLIQAQLTANILDFHRVLGLLSGEHTHCRKVPTHFIFSNFYQASYTLYPTSPIASDQYIKYCLLSKPRLKQEFMINVHIDMTEDNFITSMVFCQHEIVTKLITSKYPHFGWLSDFSQVDLFIPLYIQVKTCSLINIIIWNLTISVITSSPVFFSGRIKNVLNK